MHRYFYANDNPTRYVDPTGHAAGDFWDPRSYDWQAFKADLAQNADKRVYGIGAAVIKGSKSLVSETLTSAYDVGALTTEAAARKAGYDVNFSLYSDTANSTGERLGAGESATSIVASNVGNATATALSAGLWGTGKEYYETYRDYQSGKIDNAGVEQRLIDAAGGAVTNAVLASASARALEGRWTGGQTVVEHFTQMPSQARGLAEAAGDRLGNLAERGFENLHDVLGRNDFTSLGRIEPPVAPKTGAVLQIPIPARLRNPGISAVEKGLLERELAVKIRPLQRAARAGKLEYRPGTMDVRIGELQAEYRAEVAARYQRRFGIEPNLRLLDADHPLDLVVKGSPTQRLKMLNRSINRSVGSSLKQAAERLGLEAGDPISDILVGPGK